MFIRSQNKTVIIDMSGKAIGIDESDICVCNTVRADPSDMLVVGEYKDNKRAVEVLDGICKAYENSCIIEAHIPGETPYMMVNATVFQMPAE